MQMKKHLLTLVAGFFIGFLTHLYISLKDTSEEPSELSMHIKPHSVVQENANDNPGGVKVFVLSNPTCDSCDEIYKEMCINLSKEKLEYYAIFYPENNVDIWLASLLEEIGTNNLNLNMDNPKLKLFLWLKNNKKLWEDLTDIKDVIAILKKHDVYQGNGYLINDHNKYRDSVLYSKALTQIFNIQGIPTVVISLVLSGSDVKWSDVKPVVAQLQHLYARLKQNAKVL